MFKLTASELNCAKAAIEHHRYSTLLPKPSEWNDVAERWPALRSHLCALDLERYTPREPLTITVAKDEMNVRIVHLLHPEDMLLYTSLTLIVKDDIEEARVRRTKRRVYPYRGSQDSAKLYDSVGDTHRRYMDSLRRKAQRRSTKAIAVTDIADFYASVSQAQLKRLLKNVAQTRRSEAAAELLVSVFAAGLMAREGHGIPTGPLASRLLAEAILNDVDKHLMSRGVDFVRWVDDYNIFARSAASARAIVRDLASWLYSNCGLTLQTAKTHILNQSDYAERFLVGVEDELQDRSEILEELMHNGYELGISTGDVAPLMDDLLAVELLEMLVVDVILSEEKSNYRAISFIVRRLQKMALDRSVAREVVELLVENIEQLAPVIAEVAPLIAALLPEGKMPKRIGKRLLASLQHVGVDHHAVWILTIFAERGRGAFLDALTAVYESAESHVVRRFAILAIVGCGGNVQCGRRELEQASPLVRLALLKFSSVHGRKWNPDGKLEELVANSEDQSR